MNNVNNGFRVNIAHYHKFNKKFKVFTIPLFFIQDLKPFIGSIIIHLN